MTHHSGWLGVKLCIHGRTQYYYKGSFFNHCVKIQEHTVYIIEEMYRKKYPCNKRRYLMKLIQTYSQFIFPSICTGYLIFLTVMKHVNQIVKVSAEVFIILKSQTMKNSEEAIHFMPGSILANCFGNLGNRNSGFLEIHPLM